MKITYSKNSAKFIKKVNEPNKSRLRKAIENLPNGDIASLQGANGKYRLRVGNYRIIYRFIDKDTIYIDRIGLRGQIYNK